MSLKQKNRTGDQRARIGLRASCIGLIINLLLAITKISAGTLSGSVSILADGVNNLSDTASVVISMISLRIARKPGDVDHPFGHGRMEYLGALAISGIILYIGIDLVKSSFQAIRFPDAPVFSWWIAGITALGIPAKLFLWRYYRKHGKQYGIQPLLASAQDSFNDILITSSVVLGSLSSHFFHVTLDGWLGMMVSAFILYSGVNLIRGTINDIIGGKPDAELGKKVLEIIRRYPDIIGVHDFVLHDYGPGRSMASIHAEVNASSTLLEMHEVIDQAEQEILKDLNLPISIHLDPVVPLDTPGQGKKALIAQFLKNTQPPLSMHDFRMVPGKRQIKLIFDVAVPLDFKKDQEEKLVKSLSDYMKKIDARHQCVIKIDRDYFSQAGIIKNEKQ